MSARTKNTEPTATAAPLKGRLRLLLIEARFYEDISDLLATGAIEELIANGISYDRVSVPGALEIPQVLAQAVTGGLIPASGSNAKYAGAVALGCVIRGETSHYETVCNEANRALMDIAVRHFVPVGNGILTVENEQQALARARGGRQGKGGDAVRACVRLIECAHAFEGQVS